MPRALPSLDWLRVFAVAAATESFATAASRLGVTAGAVSQRVRSLEAHLGVALFHRHAQGIRLTEAGRRYAARIEAPLDLLAAATREVVAPAAPMPVRITVLPAFAQLWLGPRLEDFHRRHANTHVEIWADAAVVDLRTAPFDVAIRYGRPPFAGCDHRALLADALVPVASPAVIGSARRDRAGLPAAGLLNLDAYWSRDFDDWLLGTGNARPADLRIQTFSLYAMAVDAALNGRGFVMGHTALVADLVEQGRLACLADVRVPTANQFYLLTRRAAPITPAAQAFIEWIVTQ